MKKAITTILLACTMILPNTIGTSAQEIDELMKSMKLLHKLQESKKKGLRLNVSMTTFFVYG